MQSLNAICLGSTQPVPFIVHAIPVARNWCTILQLPHRLQGLSLRQRHMQCTSYCACVSLLYVGQGPATGLLYARHSASTKCSQVAASLVCSLQYWKLPQAMPD